jgi:hypothetical protein
VFAVDGPVALPDSLAEAQRRVAMIRKNGSVRFGGHAARGGVARLGRRFPQPVADRRRC